MKLTFFSRVLVLLFFVTVGSDLYAQCPFSIQNLPDTILVCKNDTVQVNPTMSSSTVVYLDTFWNTSLGVSDSNIINPTLGVGTTPITYTLSVLGVTTQTLFVNGDFSLGDNSFSTGYVNGTGGPWGPISNEGEYEVTTSPNLVHTNFAAFGDHTTGTGNMMVVNGASTPTDVWCQNINVLPNTWYDFSAWGASCVASNPAILQFTINGTPIGTSLNLGAVGNWLNFNELWFSGANTNINLCVRNQSTAASGNDFAIDDIEFREVCIATKDVVIFPVAPIAGFSSDLDLGCDQDTVNFVNNTTINTTGTNIIYFWNFGDGNFASDINPQHIYGVQGNYTVTLVATANGCSDTTSSMVNVNHPISAGFDAAPDSVCLGAPFLISNTSQATLPFPSANLFTNSWDMGDGTTFVNNTAQFPYTYSQPGSYTIRLVITDSLGCQDSSSLTVFVEDSSFVSMSASPTTVCLGEFVQFTDLAAAHVQNAMYDFGDGTVLSNIHNPRHTYEQPGNYTVTYTGQYLVCPNEQESVTIQVDDVPLLSLGPDTSYCPGLTQSITLSNIDNPSQILQWNDGSTGPTLEVDGFGRFWATTSNQACSSSDTIWVRRNCYLNIPNSFSPNADGRNDYFIPRQLLAEGLQEFSMKIFNRWGELIFETNKIDGRGWDGKFGGENQPTGVYVYVIDAQWNNNYRNSFKGNITLLR